MRYDFVRFFLISSESRLNEIVILCALNFQGSHLLERNNSIRWTDFRFLLAPQIFCHNYFLKIGYHTKCLESMNLPHWPTGKIISDMMLRELEWRLIFFQYPCKRINVSIFDDLSTICCIRLELIVPSLFVKSYRITRPSNLQAQSKLIILVVNRVNVKIPRRSWPWFHYGNGPI